MHNSPTRLVAGWTIPFWILFALQCLDIIRRLFGLWSELEFLYDKLKSQNAVFDFLLSPVGQLIIMLLCVGVLSYSFYSSRKYERRASGAPETINRQSETLRAFEKHSGKQYDRLLVLFGEKDRLEEEVLQLKVGLPAFRIRDELKRQLVGMDEYDVREEQIKRKEQRIIEITEIMDAIKGGKLLVKGQSETS